MLHELFQDILKLIQVGHLHNNKEHEISQRAGKLNIDLVIACANYIPVQ